MKRISPLLIILFSLCFSFNLHGQFSIGAGTAFGSKVDNIGFQFRGIYELEEPWLIEVDVIQYLKDADFEINGNAQYKIYQREEVFFFYGLVGFNYTKLTDSANLFGVKISTSDTGVGWNIGAGGQLNVAENIFVTTELKYVVGFARQFVLGLGGVYSF